MLKKPQAQPNLDFAGADTLYLTHNFHSFPAKFIPQLANWIITNYSKQQDLVLDPMCGSGTALVEAELLGRNAIGVDIDPLAVLLAKVKATPLEPSELKPAVSRLLDALKSDFRKLEGVDSSLFEEEPLIEYSVPEFYRRDELFMKDVQTKLGTIKARIDVTEPQEIREFFYVAFSAILKSVSNCDPKDIEPKLPPITRRKRKIPDVLGLFERKVKSMELKMLDFQQKCPRDVTVRVIRGDARRLPDEIEQVNLIITSPPYANSVDYPRVHKLSFFWLGMCGSDDLKDLAREFVGTDLVRKENYERLRDFSIPILDAPIHRITQLDRKRAGIVAKYFEGMASCFAQMSRVLAKGGVCCVVIGDSRIKKILVPTHDIFKILARNSGLKFVAEFPRIIDLGKKQTANAPNEYGGGAINIEYVLIFEKR